MTTTRSDDDPGTLDLLRAPVATVYRAPVAVIVTAETLDSWERTVRAVCGHRRKPDPKCRTCRDADRVVLAVSSGSPVQVYPSR
jgi:hypothetical protein